jgi:hypothetical protein
MQGGVGEKESLLFLGGGHITARGRITMRDGLIGGRKSGRGRHEGRIGIAWDTGGMKTPEGVSGEIRGRTGVDPGRALVEL